MNYSKTRFRPFFILASSGLGHSQPQRGNWKNPKTHPCHYSRNPNLINGTKRTQNIATRSHSWTTNKLKLLNWRRFLHSCTGEGNARGVTSNGTGWDWSGEGSRDGKFLPTRLSNSQTCPSPFLNSHQFRTWWVPQSVTNTEPVCDTFVSALYLKDAFCPLTVTLLGPEFTPSTCMLSSFMSAW